MNRAGELTKGWCPSAFTPMPSGDGLILRVRPRLGKLSYAQLAALGRVAALFSDGSLHLTARANVQIRGAREESYPETLQILAAADLVDSDPKTEAVRNIMVAPSIALDGNAETYSVARTLESALHENPAFQQMPEKFGFSFHSGGGLDLSAICDINVIGQEGRFFLLLDGDLNVSIMARSSPATTSARRCHAVVTAITKIVEVFLSLRQSDTTIRRMRDAVAKVGSALFFKAAGLEPFAHGSLIAKKPAPIGYCESLKAVGIGFAFGEISQDAFPAILKLMAEERIEEVALSQHRALVFPAPQIQSVNKLLELGSWTSAITDPDDIRLRVHACIGAPACSRGTVPARRDAQSVVHALRQSGRDFNAVHIFGCEKHCGSPGVADVVATGKSGSYELSGGSGGSRTRISGTNLPAAILACLGWAD